MLLVFLTNHSPAIKNGGQNGIHCRRRVPIIYDWVYNNYKNNNLAGFSLITTITWSLAYGCGQQWNWWRQKIHFKCWQFQWPCGYGGVMRGTFPNGAHLWLYAKPLDATIGQVLMRYCPGRRHGQRFWMKQKNINKTHFLPRFLMVDRHKKGKQFREPKRTLYSSHWCDKLRRNVKHYYSSWRAKLHFELSNVVNGQKFKKLLTLNEAKKTCGPNMAL